MDYQQTEDEAANPLFNFEGSIQPGPNLRELLLIQSAQEYKKNNKLATVFYQVVALYQVHQEKMFIQTENKPIPTEKPEPLKTDNPLVKYAYEVVSKHSTISSKDLALEKAAKNSVSNFLVNVRGINDGINKIVRVCSEMPKEWTIIQLCKGPRLDTTYSIYEKIHSSPAPIYLSIIKHARSDIYSNPICIRINTSSCGELFKRFGSVTNFFKSCVSVNVKDWENIDTKKNYWRSLCSLNKFIKEIMRDFKALMHPWNFLFIGVPHVITERRRVRIENIWRNIDSYCKCYKVNNNVAALLSLLVLNCDNFTQQDVVDICGKFHLTKHHIVKFISILCPRKERNYETEETRKSSEHFPCLLVIDQNLDHFYWEELNPGQEICRFASLQSIWCLHEYYRDNISSGYLKMNINSGFCLINPGDNLPKMSRRMNSFLNYWIPHWEKHVDTNPGRADVLQGLIKNDCYVFAGHGSGLEFISTRQITKQNIETVIFLFGCDSVRLLSNGLYSEKLGPHLYFLAAKCPCVVGTVMPGLDAHMDKIASQLLSRWIPSESSKKASWREVDKNTWIKTGKIFAAPYLDNNVKHTLEPYQKGSLCSLVADIHANADVDKLYNTVSYVYRGLPVWNCRAEDFPFK